MVNLVFLVSNFANLVSNVMYLRQENFAETGALNLNDSLLMEDSLVLTESSIHDPSDPIPSPVGNPEFAVDSSFVEGSTSNTMNQSYVSSRETPFLVDNSYTSFDRDISNLLDNSIVKGLFQITFI